MASIIEFRRRSSDTASRLGGDVKTGKILLFTGVRYERAVVDEATVARWTPPGWNAPPQPSPAQR